MSVIGKFLVAFGSLLVIIGILISFWGSVPVLGKLPGDIFFQKGALRVYLPIMTSVILSIVLTVLVNLLTRR
jgi:NAD/NADP transhydrogenase beta subunit